MYKYIIGAFLISMPVIGMDVMKDPEYAKIYKQILRNKPSIDKKYAIKLSSIVYQKCGQDAQLFAAILMQESRYKLDAVNKKSKDYGISQVNHRTAKALGLNKARLLTDLEYSVSAGVRVMTQLKTTFGSDPTYWTRYNSSKKKYRNIYLTAVSKYL